jgi:hypothetical protein
VPFKVQLFKLVAPDGDHEVPISWGIDWVITNCPDETLTAQVAQDANDVRWQVEELHRGLKQPTGTEKYQCRKARSQRNHLACCSRAWLALKVKALYLNKTLYQVKTDLVRDYLRAEQQNRAYRRFNPLRRKSCGIYTRLEEWGSHHKTVNHSAGEYARDEDSDGFHEVHVNTLEGF